MPPAHLDWPRAIAHVDMDAFFVNVYLLDHAEDANLPIAVGGRPDQRGVVASASYEARRFGVRSAMPMVTAVRICPGLKIVSADWTRIKECSRQIMDRLGEFGPLEPMSVDEAYIDLSDNRDPRRSVTAIRQQIKEETGLPASVGLATCKLVAKVASDFEKPQGLTIVRPGEERAFLAPLPVRAIWGIGPKTAERLASLSITTCAQLAVADVGEIRRQFGREAESLIRRAQGIDDRPVVTDRGLSKSISQEWTFSQDVADPDQLRAHLQKMSASVAGSLQKRQLVAHTVRIKLRWPDFTTFTRQRSLEVGTDNTETIYRVAESLWQENWMSGQPVRLLGVGVSSIRQATEKQLVFDF